jgi:hypothetical protein
LCGGNKIDMLRLGEGYTQFWGSYTWLSCFIPIDWNHVPYKDIHTFQNLFTTTLWISGENMITILKTPWGNGPIALFVEDKLGHVTPLAVRNFFFFSKLISVHRNPGRGRLIFGGNLTSPSLSFNRNSLANLGSQPVSKTHTNHSYLAVVTKRSTERLEDQLT